MLVFEEGQSKCKAFQEIYEVEVLHFLGLLTWYSLLCCL